MSLPLIAKVSVGVVGTGTVIGGGAFIAYKSLSQETIEKYLSSIHRELASSDADWELIKVNYSADKDENPIPNISKSTIGNKVEDLKRWCKDSLNEKFSQEKADRGDYDLVQTWCTKQIKISDHLKNLKLIALDISGNKDDTIWDKLRNSYTEPNGLKIKEITGQEGSKTEGSEVASLSDNQKLKTWCSWASGQYFKYKNDPFFRKYEHFCTKSSE